MSRPNNQRDLARDLIDEIQLSPIDIARESMDPNRMIRTRRPQYIPSLPLVRRQLDFSELPTPSPARSESSEELFQTQLSFSETPSVQADYAEQKIEFSFDEPSVDPIDQLAEDLKIADESEMDIPSLPPVQRQRLYQPPSLFSIYEQQEQDFNDISNVMNDSRFTLADIGRTSRIARIRPIFTMLEQENIREGDVILDETALNTMRAWVDDFENTVQAYPDRATEFYSTGGAPYLYAIQQLERAEQREQEQAERIREMQRQERERIRQEIEAVQAQQQPDQRRARETLRQMR